MKAVNISQYIIACFDSYGDLITNKKLQKLLYYIEAWGLVHLNGIIDEDFVAWVHGPVIPEIYNKYKKYGYSPLKNEDIKDYNSSGFCSSFHKENTQDNCDLIDSVLDKYGKLTAMELELLCHSEKPWMEAREGLSPVEYGNRVINKNTMKEYYKNLLNQ